MVLSPSSWKPVGAIDIGTNSILLTIAEATKDGGKRILLDRATVTRLGEGVDKTRQLTAGAVERSLACLADYARCLEQHGVTQLEVVGTSALRDATNGQLFLDAAESRLGARPRVIAGFEEARLTCLGAVDGLDVMGPLFVFDVGGGSTEFIVARRQRSGLTLERFTSLDIGCVRLTERCLRHDPPSDEEITSMSTHVDDALRGAGIARGEATVVAVAGTVTTLSAMHQGLATYEPARVHGSALSLAAIAALRTSLLGMNAAARRKLVGLDPRRADVIGAGALIVERILRWLHSDALRVSDRGVRFGLVSELLKSDSAT